MQLSDGEAHALSQVGAVSWCEKPQSEEYCPCLDAVNCKWISISRSCTRARKCGEARLEVRSEERKEGT